MPVLIGKLVAWLGLAFSRVFLAFVGYLNLSRVWLVGAFWFVAFNIATSLVFTVLTSLGIGFVTYNLSSFGLDLLFERLVLSFNALPEEILVFIKLAKVDEFLSIVFGALSARLTLAGFSLISNTKQVTTTFYA